MGPNKIWAMENLPFVGDGARSASGLINFCCSPCVCDTNDLIKVDTRTFEFADGPKQLRFLTIGDPCSNPTALDEPFIDPFDGSSRTLRQAAPELACDDSGRLKGAHFSDHGEVIIGLLRDKPADIGGTAFTESSLVDDMCASRAAEGYRSGMGLIFRLTAEVSLSGADG